MQHILAWKVVLCKFVLYLMLECYENRYKKHNQKQRKNYENANIQKH
jgi:hypothetical protein